MTATFRCAELGREGWLRGLGESGPGGRFCGVNSGCLKPGLLSRGRWLQTAAIVNLTVLCLDSEGLFKILILTLCLTTDVLQ